MSCSCNHKDVDNDAWIEETLIKFIKCLCSCGPSKPGEPSNCVATFLTGEQIDDFPEYISYSKNGGPFKDISIFDMEPNGIPYLINMLKNEDLTGFAFTTLDSFHDNMSATVEFCGLSSDGSFVSSKYPNGFKPINLSISNGNYPSPFNVKPEKNTLTFRASDVLAHKDIFQCLNNPTEAETLTLESCAILEVLADPLPLPPPIGG